ncbi:MAG: universal stress protein [Sandaracinaceae bacterium]|nr:universal stress protein [Sandaracinaceae bacterium]
MTERTIVFATDLTGAVDSGLALATRLAADHAATLVLLHVLPLQDSSGEAMLHEVVQLREGDAERKLRALIPPDPSVPYRHVTEVGQPEKVIIEVAKREKAYLLVMEERPRRWFKGAIRSLPARILGHAPCPVVVYRPGSELKPKSEVSTKRQETPLHQVEVLDLLTGLLEARVEALVTWMDQRQEAVARIADSARDSVASILRAPSIIDHRSPVGRIHRRLTLQLDEHQRALGAIGVALSWEQRVLFQQGGSALDEEVRAGLRAKITDEGRAISLPLDGDADCSPPNGLVMLVGARIEVPGPIPALLVFTLDARRDFLHILAQPGPTPSCETYAFDRNGMMLSNSRFPAELRAMGLLPLEPGAQAPLRLRVSAPTVEANGRGDDAQPLTRMAADATLGNDGADWRGYADYRGVEVVGAWKWIPRYEFGVAAEMDRAPSE